LRVDLPDGEMRGKFFEKFCACVRVCVCVCVRLPSLNNEPYLNP
jgi:hypothetical protein